ncbi:hypothetical protein GCM10009682_37620 [Luedemannella flava]|uniref:Uncharacterized protein n=1 Tax=Luedemannella flava TaxID=349316 RepID=A0ABN2M774_9ACTN
MAPTGDPAKATAGVDTSSTTIAVSMRNPTTSLPRIGSRSYDTRPAEWQGRHSLRHMRTVGGLQGRSLRQMRTVGEVAACPPRQMLTVGEIPARSPGYMCAVGGLDVGLLAICAHLARGVATAFVQSSRS